MKYQISKIKYQKYKVKFKILFTFLIVIFHFYFLIFNLSEANAQTLDPITWQTGATGLKTQTLLKTAGLGFNVERKNWPFLSAQGGVKNALSWRKRTIQGPVGIELGKIKIPQAQTVTFTTETADWSHNEMTFSYDSTNQLKIWASRLSPAIMIQNPSSSIRLFSEPVNGNEFFTNQWNQQDIRSTLAPSYPKYVAYSNGGSVRVQTLSTSDLSLSPDQNWLLVWYGNNSHFLDTKTPYSGEYWAQDASIPYTDAYKADIPILLVFQNTPSTIKHSLEGGVDLSFASQTGNMLILPLLGREHLSSIATETWASTLPQNILTRISFWSQHLCSFPSTVSESYSYNQTTDTTTITENISFIQACSGGTSFAPLPPMLSIAKDSFPVQFSGTVIDGNLPTEFGPSLGIENTNSYTWSISGLKKFTDSKRNLGNGQVPIELEQELNSEVQKIISDGHYAPWIFLGGIPVHDTRGEIFWLNPADIIYHLSEVADSLPAGNIKTSLIDYITSERNTYPPETTPNLSVSTGKFRESYTITDSSMLGQWDGNDQYSRPDLYLKKVPLYNFYSLSKYYDLIQQAPSAQTIQAAKDALNRDMSEQDWATSFWFKGFEDRKVAVVNANRHFAGVVGFIKLANLAGDTQAENIGRALLAKAAVLRIALAKHPRYLYSVNIVKTPSDPLWDAKYSAAVGHVGYGHIFNYYWVSGNDDARQVTLLDQFGVYLVDHSHLEDWASSYLTAFRDMVPETGRLLSDYAKTDAEIYINKVEALFPSWYAVFYEDMIGHEHAISFPVSSFQIFMAKEFISEESAQNLRRYKDISWLEAGDLFYVQKLAEVVKAYKTWSWSDSPLPSVSPSPTPAHCTPLGDIDCSGKVNVLDLSILLGAFGSTTNRGADLDDSGRVNVLDLSILLGNFGK